MATGTLVHLGAVLGLAALLLLPLVAGDTLSEQAPATNIHKTSTRVIHFLAVHGEALQATVYD